MLDNFGRNIYYARISITDRCNLRCVYCMPESGVEKLDSDDILSYEEIIRVCRVLARQGICKLKITGGEPLVREGVASLIAQLKQIPEIEHVSLTTNGLRLSYMAEDLAAANLDSINISLDSMDADRYRAMTRIGSVDTVLLGIERAVSAGIKSIKVNCVPITDVNEQDIVSLAALAKDQTVHVRFIEMMPMGLGKHFPRVEPQKIHNLLTSVYGPMTHYDGKLGNGPAVYYSLPGFKGKIGLINAVSGCFCDNCNRIRLTAEGTLKTCLHLDKGISLLDALSKDDDDLLTDQIVQAIWNKPAMHGFKAEKPAQEEDRRIMSQIGG